MECDKSRLLRKLFALEDHVAQLLSAGDHG